MKILLFSYYFMTNMEYMENAFCREFITRGHDVKVVTTNALPDWNNNGVKGDTGFLTNDSNSLNPNYQSLGIVRLKTRKIFNTEIPVGLMGEIVKFKPDLIFFQSLEHYIACLYGILGKYIIGARMFTVVNEHFIYKYVNGVRNDNSESGKVKNAIVRFIKYLCLLFSDKIVTMNEYCSKAADYYYKNSGKKKIEITLGVDDKVIYFKNDKRDNIRNSINVSESDFVFVHSGKLRNNKKIEVIIEALFRIKNSNVKLLLIGNGPVEYVTLLKTKIKDLGLTERIIFIDFVKKEELHYYYSASDAAVWTDGLTISTIEASAVGIPVIVPDYEGYEHRTKNENGLRVKPGDADDLEEKMKFLIDNPEKRILMGRNGRELVENELNWHNIVDKLNI